MKSCNFFGLDKNKKLDINIKNKIIKFYILKNYKSYYTIKIRT